MLQKIVLILAAIIGTWIVVAYIIMPLVRKA